MKKNNSNENLKPISVKDISLGSFGGTMPTISSVSVTPIGPIAVAGGYINYVFKVTLDGTDYTFTMNQQGLLQLNDGDFQSGTFHFTLK